jgi:uncharacterized protein
LSDEIVDSEVTWKVLDVSTSGTVTGPSSTEPHPAVILLAGSGPTDRDWRSLLLPGNNGTGKMLAEALARRGFVTLRYDKLGSGPHVRENISKFSGKVSMQTFVDELRGAIGTVISEKNVDRNYLFALTNSEGAIHAVNYQIQSTRDRFRGLVLTGAPGRAIGAVARSQILAQAKGIPNGDSLMKLYDQNIAEFLASKPMAFDPALPEALKPLLRALEVPANLPFSRELWNYNLPEHLEEIHEPIHVLIGKKDVQVDWKVDGGELERVTSGRNNVSFTYPENANHVLKHEELPLESLTPQYVQASYNAPEARLDEEAANDILDWLNAQRER